jgi:hypothetical protein
MLKTSMDSLGFNEVTSKTMIKNLKNKVSFLIKQIKTKPNNNQEVLSHKNKKFPILNYLIQTAYKM